MNVTKYEHSCMVVSKGNARLVIDPGMFLATLPDAAGVVAIVITHEHADHFSVDRVSELLEANPDARVFGPQGSRMPLRHPASRSRSCTRATPSRWSRSPCASSARRTT
ncbi:hypothetical protein GCM10025869_02580 [Homoserinibacter gongjuensis]|uniref:MBL fold metallo-hydrolase n=1 Tax=Homoserinibacter gongjuensis TaxID=1162968 RepID=A0ABQ6JP63_9MICO|nr:hypothetical protein GCM10025869_02580 [Homoserinibacter gongjuensis]